MEEVGVVTGELRPEQHIAERLVLAEGIVKNHVSSILMKLHANNRTQAANLAQEPG